MGSSRGFFEFRVGGEEERGQMSRPMGVAGGPVRLTDDAPPLIQNLGRDNMLVEEQRFGRFVSPYSGPAETQPPERSNARGTVLLL